MVSSSPSSSVGELEKEVGLEKAHHEEPKLTKGQEVLLEAAEPPFTEHVEPSSNGSDGGELEKVASAKPSVTNIKFVPNGGLRAWLQVLGSFFIYWNAWGIVNTFGTYQT